MKKYLTLALMLVFPAVLPAENLMQIGDMRLRSYLAFMAFKNSHPDYVANPYYHNISAGAVDLKLFSFNKEFRNDDLMVKIISAPFNPALHEIVDAGGFILIDNRRAYGCFDTAPETALSSIKLSFKGKELTVPSDALKDLYNPEQSGLVSRTGYSSDGRYLIVNLQLGYGAAQTEVSFVFLNGAFEKRIILAGN